MSSQFSFRQGFFIIILIVMVGPIVVHVFLTIEITQATLCILYYRLERPDRPQAYLGNWHRPNCPDRFGWKERCFSYNILDHDRRSGDPIIHFSWAVHGVLMFPIQVNSATSQWDYRMAVSETLKWQRLLNGTNTTHLSWGGSIALATGSTWVPGAREATIGISTYRSILKGLSR